MSSLLGIRVRIDHICRDCELEISEILLTIDLRVMDMSDFDVILGMDWLTAHRVVINCDHKRITAYTHDVVCVIFNEDKHDTPGCVRLEVAQTDDRLAGKPYPRG